MKKGVSNIFNLDKLKSVVAVTNDVKEIHEHCVACGKPTEMKRSDSVTLRKHYVEGAGQLCDDCYNRIYE